MEDVMVLRVVTPAGELYHGGVTMVEFNTAGGRMGVYPKHIPVMVAAAPGVLKIHEGDRKREAFLVSGLIQILPEKVTILADDCEWPEDD